MDLNELRKLSKRLNDTTDDELNAQLQLIEDQIAALSLGVEAWISNKPLDEAFSDGRSTLNGFRVRQRVASELGYARISGRWKLAVRVVAYTQSTDGGDDGWRDTGTPEISRYAKPLLRASRNLRATAVDRIPELIDALHGAGSKVADALEKARNISHSLE